MTIGLRAKLLIPSALITVALLASVSYYAMRRTASALLAEDDLRLRQLVTQLAIASEFGVEWRRREDLPPRLDEIVETPSVCWLVVHGQDGAPLLTAHRAGAPKPRVLEAPWTGPLPGRVEVVTGERLGLSSSVLEYRAPVLRTVVGDGADHLGPLEDLAEGAGVPFPSAADPTPVARETERTPIGVVRVGMTQEHSRGEARGIAFEIGMVALAIGLLGTGLFWMVGRAIARPILRLVEDTRALAAGNLRHRTVVPDTREIATLAHAFNRMGERLAVYHEQIVEQNQTLERKVEERTAELTRALEELQRLDRLKDEFLSNISHEFRTPLTSIRSYGEILRDYADEDPAMRTEFLSIIVAESERLTRLIEETLDLSKIRSGTVQWRQEELALAHSVREVFARLEPVAARGKVALELVEQDLDVFVLADADRLVQVWTNLVGNAIKFSPQGSTVGVIVRRSGPWACVDVVDDGPGIPLEDQDRIFEQFGQSGDLMTDKPVGTGLGLTIATEIAGHFGGDITVVSAPGEGATFTVCLPLAGTTVLAESVEPA